MRPFTKAQSMMPEMEFSSEGNQLDPTGSCYMGLKQRESLEDKDGKTNFCQYWYKKC